MNLIREATRYLITARSEGHSLCSGMNRVLIEGHRAKLGTWRVPRAMPILILLLLGLVLVPIRSSGAGALEVKRQNICLNGEWLFHGGGEESELPLDETDWDVLRVPGKWGHFSTDKIYGVRQEWIKLTTGWYKLDFLVPKDWNDGRLVKLRFDGVNHYARVFLNGRFCAENYSVYIPFEVDITKVARYGEKNQLLVFVRDLKSTPYPDNLYLDSLNSMTSNNVGIQKDVWLRSYPPIYVKDVFIMTSVREKKLTARIWIRNEGNSTRKVNLINIVRKGNEVKLSLRVKKVAIKAKETRMIEVARRWPDPELWGFGEYGSPVLYFLTTTIKEGSKIIDTKYTRFGFREFGAGDKGLGQDPTKFYLNGKQILLQGDGGGIGTDVSSWADNRQFITRLLKLERGANINFWRNHHQPGPSVWYDVADELGMLMEPEAYYITTSQDPIWLENAKKILRAWVKEHRNHPSIVIWSADNEFCTQGAGPKPHPSIWKLQKEMAKEIKKHDPTRLVDHQGDVNLGLCKAFGFDYEIDIFNIHPYGEPLYKEVERIKKEFHYNGKIPILIGEMFLTSNPTRGITAKEIDADPVTCYGRFMAHANFWYDSILSLKEIGVAGITPFTVHGFGCWGLDLEGNKKFGPWDYKGEGVRWVDVPWPSLSGEGPKVMRFRVGKGERTINWFDPKRPECNAENLIYETVRDAFREAAGKDMPPLNPQRAPEVIVRVTEGGRPVSGIYVFLEPLSGQSANPIGVMTDKDGTAWFVLKEEGRYRITRCDAGGFAECGEVVARCGPLDSKPGYSHIQWVNIQIQ